MRPVLALLLFAAPLLTADTIVYSDTIDYSYSLTAVGPLDVLVPQFDPSLGVLQAVTIGYSQDWTITLYTGDGGYGPNEPYTGGGGSFEVAGDLGYGDAVVSGQNMATGYVYYEPNQTLTAEASAGWNDGFLNGDAIADAMTGTGTVSWSSLVDIQWSYSCDCPGSSSSIASDATVDVSYYYTAPEAQTQWLCGGGLVVLWRFRKRPTRRTAADL